MSKFHADLPPSSAHRWVSCTNSVKLSKNLPDVQNDYALFGSACHVLAQYCFQDRNDAVKHVGKMYSVAEVDACPIDEDMASLTQVYVDFIRRESHKKKLLIEQRLPLFPITGEKDAFGTADAVIIDGDKLIICDLKTGRNKVEAKENTQLMMYTAAAAIEYSVFGNFTEFKVVIVQPSLDWVDEWEFDVRTLGAFVAGVREAANKIHTDTGEYNPTEDNCRFCKAKAVCPALAEQVAKLTEGGFDDLDKKSELDLSKAMRSVGMVEDWCLAIRAETERRLVSGIKVAGWKLVGGRMGARQWADAKEAENVMVTQLRLSEDKIYKKTLQTPAQIEKVLAKEPEQWNKLQALITQKEGAPSVAPSTDPRQEIGSAADSFEDLGDAV